MKSWLGCPVENLSLHKESLRPLRTHRGGLQCSGSPPLGAYDSTRHKSIADVILHVCYILGTTSSLRFGIPPVREVRGNPSLKPSVYEIVAWLSCEKTLVFTRKFSDPYAHTEMACNVAEAPHWVLTTRQDTNPLLMSFCMFSTSLALPRPYDWVFLQCAR